MPLATALVTANDPHPQLAEEAVRQAQARAGLTQATGVLLFLTPEFSRHAQPAVTAAARAALLCPNADIAARGRPDDKASILPFAGRP